MTTSNLYEALLPYHDMLADISFISESEHVKRYAGRFIGQIGYSVNRSLDIEYPMVLIIEHATAEAWEHLLLRSPFRL